MQINAETLRDYTLKNPEGGIGRVSELYFDDDWSIRYLTADSGTWLFGKSVLIPADSLTGRSDSERTIKTRLTKQEISDGPSPAILMRKTDGEHGHHSRPDGRPVPFYRGGILSWRTPTSRNQPIGPPSFPASGNRSPGAVHVHGVQEVNGYELLASDGSIGRIKDFIIDDELWKIRFLVVEPRYWWLGSILEVTPEWINQGNWSEGRLSLTLPRTLLQVSPPPPGVVPPTIRESREYDHTSPAPSPALTRRH